MEMQTPCCEVSVLSVCFNLCSTYTKHLEKCQRIEYFCADYNLFILKVTDPNVNPSKDINKKALSVEHAVAHYVCVA